MPGMLISRLLLAWLTVLLGVLLRLLLAVLTAEIEADNCPQPAPPALV